MTELRVEMHGVLMGNLVGEKGKFDFVASDAAVRTYGIGSVLLSLAIPLVPKAGRAGGPRRRNFFEELLAEGEAREQLRLEAGLAKGDTMGMLSAYGRDVAGALQIWDPTDPEEPRTPAIELLDDAGVEQMLEDVANTPLGNKPRRGKTSLNGVQNKIVLVRAGTQWARAVDGYPSTHIVKPVVGKYPTMIFDEEYGSRFARELGLADFDTRLEKFNRTTALVIERYDRDSGSIDGRIHQEDFSQALGLSGDEKYEMYGRKTLRDVAKLLGFADKRRLLMMATLSVALGNLDMHAKNISVLHDPDGSIRLAPMYDVVPQVHQNNDGEMAFSVGGVFTHADINRDHLMDEGRAWGVRDAAEVVNETTQAISRIAAVEKPHVAAHAGLQEDVLRFTGNLIDGLSAGGKTPGGAVSSKPRSRTADGGWSWQTQVVAPEQDRT